jgi:hypothetical protein
MLMTPPEELSNMLKIEEPFHGAVINHRYGTQTAAGLTITVTGQAPPYGTVTVNNIPAKVTMGRFSCDITVTEAEQDIVAAYQGSYGRQQHAVRVVWDRHSQPRYRFSIDDNSFWLRDIARQQYESLFDCFYLDILRNLNREYGARFTLNIYHHTADGFELDEFPDRYKSEFADSADWLVLAFHARANDPDRLYQYASPDVLIADLDRVNEQIIRFAGEETLAPPTVIHWGMVLPEALPLLYERGVRVLSGFHSPTPHGYDVNYWLDDARSEWAWHHEALKDFNSGIIFSRVDIVCNNTPVDRVEATLQPLYDNPLQAEIMDLFTHEQYFWPFYTNHIPDHADRLDAAIGWVTERGYEPVFFHEGFLGGPMP